MPDAHGDDLTPRDELADRLRRRDAQLRGQTAGLLTWVALEEPEQQRWGAMADEAVAGVTAAQDVARLATPSLR